MLAQSAVRDRYTSICARSAELGRLKRADGGRVVPTGTTRSNLVGQLGGLVTGPYPTFVSPTAK